MHDQMDVILHDLKLRDAGVVLFVLGGLCVCVAHNRNEHIQENNLDEEGRAEEEDVAQSATIAIGVLLITSSVRIGGELTETQLVLVLKYVDEP